MGRSQLFNQLQSLLNKSSESVSSLGTVKSVGKQFSRRKFLTETLKASAAVVIAATVPSILLGCGEEPKNPGGKTDSNLLDVAILGAGIAGLNCANHLLGSGLSFKVFEGGRRVGGRILTHYNDSMQLGIFPEFGGDFIDSNHEDMLALAKEFNLELLDLIQEQEDAGWVKDAFYFDNRKISEEEIIEEFKKIASKISADEISLGEDYDTEAAVRLDQTPLSDYIKSLNCKQWLKDLFVAAFVAEYGLDCEEQSTINMLDMIESDTDGGFLVFGESDERFRIKGGNSKIIERLVQKIGEKRIALNYAVTAIKEEEEHYLITFVNGKQVKAKKIVFTIPFTILREIKLELKGMTAEKQKCINELGYGNNTKLILGYEGQPWRSPENKAMGYLFTNDMTNGWDGSVNKTDNNPYGAYVTYFGGAFSQQLCDLSFKNPMAPPTHAWRTELPAKTVKGFVEELDKIYKHSKEKFQGKHVFVNWIEYPWVKASYSCYKTGQWTTIAGYEMEPIGNFYFAGEHCSELFQGFMNGAAETGKRVGQQIVKQLETVL